MKRCCHCKQVKPFNEFNKNRSSKDGYSFDCRSCKVMSAKKFYQKNKSKILGYQQNYRVNNQEKIRLRGVEYRESHREENLRRAITWYENNKHFKQIYDTKYREKRHIETRQASKMWRKKHPGKKNADTALRRAIKMQATPRWADLKTIKNFYENCPKGYQVNHIIPLRGKNVSGLHILENLQYLPIMENLKKSNHYSYEEN